MSLERLAARLPPFRVPRPSLSRRVRVGLLGIAIASLVGLYVWGSQHAVATHLEASLSANQGTTTVRLNAETDAVSPGCGCYEPAFGKLAWYGMALPSDGFNLSLEASSPEKVTHHEWALEGIAPQQDVVDWAGVPDHSLEMTVFGYVHEHRRKLFRGRVGYFLLLAQHAIRVQQSPRYPYAALLPAANGATTFVSKDAARPGCCGQLDITSTAPARGSLPSGPESKSQAATTSAAPPEGEASEAEEAEEESAPEPVDIAQRGPMVDVLGPSVSFEFEGGRPLIWAGLEQVRLPSSASGFEVKIQTPFSVRLIPHPVRREWRDRLPTAFVTMFKQAARRKEIDFLKELTLGPRAQGRFLATESLPAYTVRLSELAVPSEVSWHSFESRSSANVSIKPFIGASKWDEEVTAIYGLPPVSKLPEVGIFGPVGLFESDAVRGDLLSGGHITPVALGQSVKLSSTAGLDAGQYRFTPLVSAGVPGEEAQIAGSASAIVGGSPTTRGWWLPWLLGALTAAIVSLAVEAIVAWIRKANG
jgi:hypothetical protein